MVVASSPSFSSFSLSLIPLAVTVSCIGAAQNYDGGCCYGSQIAGESRLIQIVVIRHAQGHLSTAATRREGRDPPQNQTRPSPLPPSLPRRTRLLPSPSPWRRKKEKREEGILRSVSQRGSKNGESSGRDAIKTVGRRRRRRLLKDERDSGGSRRKRRVFS